MLAHCSPSSKWVPGGNTGEINAVKKGTGHPTSHADGSGNASSLAGTPLGAKVYGTTFIFYQYLEAFGGPLDSEDHWTLRP